MMNATSRMLYGGAQHNPPSRFLSEIDTQFQPPDSTYGLPTPMGSGDRSRAGNSPHWGEFSGSASAESPNPMGASRPHSDEPRYVPDLTEGDGVQHPTFGVGTVVELDGDNATIFFKGKGAKKLNIAFAPLEKLD